MKKGNILQSVRAILKNRLNSFIIVISLTIGLSAAFIILSWASFEYSYDNFHSRKDRIYRVLDHQTFKGQDEQYLAQVPEYLVNTFEEEIPGIELSTILLRVGSFWVTEGQNMTEVTDAFYSDNNLFNVFSLNFISGNPEKCLSEPNSVVLTKQTAEKLFGKTNPIGKTIKRDNKREYVVSAVIDDIPVNSHLSMHMLLPIDERKPRWNRNNGNHNASIYVLLKKGTNVKNLKRNLRQFTNVHFPWDTSNNFDLQLQPLNDLHLNSKHTMWELNKNKFNKTYVSVLILIALLLLSISSINFFNLTLVSLSKRKTEIGIKKINGSNRIQIVRQFLFENLLVATIAFVSTMAVVVLCYPYLQANFFSGYKLGDLLTFRIFFSFLGLVFMLIVITGLFPSLSYSLLSPISMLRGTSSKKSKRRTFNQYLVISQLVVTSFLIIATLGIGKQMEYIKNKDLGFKTDQVMILPAISNSKENYPALKEELLKNPNITQVTASSRIVGEEFWRNTIEFEGEAPDARYVVPYLITDADFPEFFQMEIVQGRSFSKELNFDINGKSFLINESLARQMGYDKPIGKKMRFAHTKMGEIVGVVKDFHAQSLHKAIEPMAFYIGDNELNRISVKVSPTNLSSTLVYVEKTWKKFRPDRPFQYQFLDKKFANLYENDTKTTKLVLLFTLIAIILSSLGLFGLIAFVAEQKTKEIGVRRVNGATILEITRMLNKSYLVWGIIGFGIACPMGYFAIHRWLEGFAYKTSLSWWIFALSGIVAIGISLLTVSLQSWRAATRNPVENLRYE